MIRSKLFIYIFLVAAGMAPEIALAQRAAMPDFGKGISHMAADSSFSLKFNMRMQQLFDASYSEANDRVTSQFLVRRARLKFAGFVLSDKLTYKIELGLSNRDLSIDKEDGNGKGASRVILDMVAKWKFVKHWELWVGQAKLPGNRERVISSSDLQFVDRSLLNGRYTLDRDVGLQLHGHYEIGNVILMPALALTQGEGRNITAENFGGYNYLLHLEVLPLGSFTDKKGAFVSSDLLREPVPKLAVGITLNRNQDAVRQGGQLGSFVRNDEGIYVENTLHTFFADVMFKYRGFSLMSEYGRKSSDRQFDVTNNFLTGEGFSIQGGSVNQKGFEVALRYTTVHRDHDFSLVRDENHYTLGLSKYIVGHHLKVQSDLTRISFPHQADGKYQFRVQLEMQL